ncbi:MAG: hypothetical protein U0903_01640 [Planctomycetales bacterium]
MKNVVVQFLNDHAPETGFTPLVRIIMQSPIRFLWIVVISSSLFVSAQAEPPKDAESATEYRARIGKLAREVISPERGWADQYAYDQQTAVGTRVLEGQIARKDRKQVGAKLRYVLFEPEQFSGSAILWLDGAEKSPSAAGHSRHPSATPRSN